MDVIELALADRSEYPGKPALGYRALAELGERLRQEYRSAYGNG